MNTAIFSVVDAVMLRPLPYAFPERLVFLQENSPSLEGMSVAFPNYLDWQAQTQVFEYIAARPGGGGGEFHSGAPGDARRSDCGAAI